MANEIQDVVIKVRVDNDQVKTRMREAGGVVQDEVNKIGRAFSTLSYYAIGAAAAIASISIKGMKDFALAEKSTLRLEAVLKATGGAAGFTAQQIAILGDEIESTTFFTSEQVQDAAAVLATFKSITGETFKETIGIVTDLAEVFQMDLKSAATQVGKALEDPINGLTALRRVGVSFNDEQKAMIENMVAVGDVAGAQAEILKVLQEQVGGAAAGAASELAGAFDNATDAVGNFLESVGGIAAGLTDAKNFIGEFTIGVNYLTDALNGIPGRMEWVAKSKAQGFVTEATFLQPKAQSTSIRAKTGSGSSSISSSQKAINDELSKQKAILDAIKTPQQEYNEKMAEAKDLLDKGKITLNDYNLYQDKMAENFNKVGESAIINARIISDKFGDALESALFDAKNFGQGFSQVMEGIARDLLRQNVINPFTSSITSSIQSSGIFNNLFSSFSSALPSFDVGSSYVPRDMMANIHQGEMIIPKAQADMLRAGGGGGNVTVNVVNNTSSQVSVSQSRNGNGQSIAVQIDDLVAGNIAKRGTRTNEALRALQTQSLINR